MATISRLLKIIGLFCRISSLLQGSFAKETCNFKEPTNRSHPIVCFCVPVPVYMCVYVRSESVIDFCATCICVCVFVCVCERERERELKNICITY